MAIEQDHNTLAYASRYNAELRNIELMRLKLLKTLKHTRAQDPKLD